MATWTLALFVPLLLHGCGSGQDEIQITCTNSGTGKQICGATSGAGVDINSPEQPAGR